MSAFCKSSQSQQAQKNYTKESFFASNITVVSIGEPKGGCWECIPPSHTFFFHFTQFSGGNGQYNRLVPTPLGLVPSIWEILDPPLDVLITFNFLLGFSFQRLKE